MAKKKDTQASGIATASRGEINEAAYFARKCGLTRDEALQMIREAHGSPDPQGWLVYQVSHHGGTPIIQRILQHVGMEIEGGAELGKNPAALEIGNTTRLFVSIGYRINF